MAHDLAVSRAVAVEVRLKCRQHVALVVGRPGGHVVGAGLDADRQHPAADGGRATDRVEAFFLPLLTRPVGALHRKVGVAVGLQALYLVGRTGQPTGGGLCHAGPGVHGDGLDIKVDRAHA